MKYLLIIGSIFYALYIFFQEYNFRQKEIFYSVGKIDKLWWEEGSGKLSDYYYASYRFKTKNGKTIIVKKDSIRFYLWEELGDGEAPAMVEYFPEKNPTNYRIVGDDDMASGWLYMAFGVFLLIMLYIDRKPAISSQINRKKKKRLKKGKRKRKK